MAVDKLFYIGVKALIFNPTNKILLLHAGLSPHRAIKAEYWDLPAGRMQPGQTPLETLAMEIEEELGPVQTTEPNFLTTVISNHITYEGERELGLALLIYELSIPENSTITISEEHTAHEWVTKTEAKKRLAHKYPKEFTDSL